MLCRQRFGVMSSKFRGYVVKVSGSVENFSWGKSWKNAVLMGSGGVKNGVVAGVFNNFNVTKVAGKVAGKFAGIKMRVKIAPQTARLSHFWGVDVG